MMKKITFLFLASLCSLLSFAQLTEDFDTGVFPPTGWATFIGANGAGTVSNWTTRGTSPDRTAFVDFENSGLVNQDWLVTPLVAITASNDELTFNQTARFSIDYGSTYTIRVSTASQTTISDFTIIDTQTETDVFAGSPDTLASYSVDLSAYIGQSIYVAFVLEQNDGDAWIIDDVSINTPPACAPATNLSFDDFTTTTADISWDNAGTYSIEFGEFPYTQGGMGTTAVVTGDNYQLTTLTPGVSYEVYVTQDCGVAGSSSTESVLVGTSPDLANATFPFNQDFEVNPNQALLLNLGVSFFTNTNNWDYGQDNLADGDTTNDRAFNGVSFFSSNNTFTDAAADATIYLGPFSLLAANEYTFSFQQRNLVASSATIPAKDFELLAAPLNDGSANTVLATFADTDNIVYALRSGTFIPPTDGTYYFGVRDNTDQLVGVTGGNRVFIDDVNISSVPLSIEGVKGAFFTLSPNPAADFIQINSTSTIDTIEIYNSLGQRVMSDAIISNNAIDINKLDSGIYFMKVTSSERAQTLKFIKK